MVFWNLLQKTVRPLALPDGEGGWGGLQGLMPQILSGPRHGAELTDCRKQLPHV
jgi:hypothetical protein